MFLARFRPLNREHLFVCVHTALLVSEGLAEIAVLCLPYLVLLDYIRVHRVWIHWLKRYNTYPYCSTYQLSYRSFMGGVWRLQLRWHHPVQTQKKTYSRKNCDCRVNGRVDQSAVLRVAARYARYVPKYGRHYLFPCGAYRRSDYDHNGGIIIIIILDRSTWPSPYSYLLCTVME